MMCSLTRDHIVLDGAAPTIYPKKVEGGLASMPDVLATRHSFEAASEAVPHRVVNHVYASRVGAAFAKCLAARTLHATTPSGGEKEKSLERFEARAHGEDDARTRARGPEGISQAHQGLPDVVEAQGSARGKPRARTRCMPRQGGTRIPSRAERTRWNGGR